MPIYYTRYSGPTPANFPQNFTIIFKRKDITHGIVCWNNLEKQEKTRFLLFFLQKKLITSFLLKIVAFCKNYVILLLKIESLAFVLTQKSAVVPKPARQRFCFKQNLIIRRYIMSDQNEKKEQNINAELNVDSVQNGSEMVKQPPSKFAMLLKAATTPTPRITDIDWSKKKAPNKAAWENLDPKLKKDWAIWRDTKAQNTFATVAVLFEIISVIAIALAKDSGAGMIVLLVIADIAAITITIMFKKIIYRALRVLLVSLIPAVLASLASFMVFPVREGDNTSSICSILAILVVIGIVSFLEIKGKLGKKHPPFQKPKKAASSRSKGPGLMTWFNNTMNAWDDAGVTNRDLYQRQYNRKKTFMNYKARVEDGAVNLYDADTGSFQRYVCCNAVSAYVDGEFVVVTKEDGSRLRYDVYTGNYEGQA